MHVRLWKFRHRLAWWIAPGVHKHLSTFARHDECPRALCQVSARLTRHSVEAMDDLVRSVSA